MENNNSWVQSLINSKYVLILVTLIFLLLVIVVSVGLFTDKHINVFGLEFNGNKNVPVTEKPIVEKEKAKELEVKEESIKKTFVSPISVKSEKVIKKENPTNLQAGNGNIQSPVNISSTNQTGGITAQNVNVTTKPQPRKLNDYTRNQLISYLNNKSEKIDISCIMNDHEAFDYANEIENFLLENGYTNINGGNQAVFSKPFKGQEVFRTNSGVKISIGSQN